MLTWYRSILFLAIFFITGFSLPSPNGSIAVAERLPKPDKEKIASATQDILDLFEREYTQAKDDRKACEALATMLLNAVAEENDPVMRYTLFKEAITLQVKARLVEELVKTTDEMTQEFSVDNIEIKTHFLKKIAHATKKKSEKSTVAEVLQSTMEQALATDRYDEAMDLITVGATLGEQTKDLKLVKRFKTLAENIREERNQFHNVEKAQEALEQKPLDAEANLIVGQWYCLKKNQWDEGVTYLALCNHPEMQTLGRMDLKIDKSAVEIARLGDLCWELAESMPQDRIAFQNRAIYWYKNAEPQLSGIVKKKVLSRIDQWDAENSPPEKEKPRKKKEEEPKLARSPKPLSKVKHRKAVAPIGPGGIPLGNRKSTVYAGTVPIRIQGKNNIYLHPFPPDRGVSAMMFKIDGRYRSFTGRVGVPKVPRFSGGPRSEILFWVLADGKKIEIARTDRSGKASLEPFSIDITGVKELTLVTSCRGNPEGCFAFWFDPVLSPKEAEQISEREER